MAYSYFKYEGDGSTTTFAIPFALGILKKEDVTVRVGDEQDSSGQPIYRTWDFLPGNTGMIKIDGTPPKVGETVRISRTVSKTKLVHDFQKGEPLDELSLDESHEQLMMAVQEALDGRGGISIVDLDMNGNVIRNVGIDKTDPTSAINYGLYQVLEQKMDDSYVNADRAETAASNAEASGLAAAESARQAKLSEQAAKASETAAATSEGIASAAAAAAADDSAATADDRIHVDAVAGEIKNLTAEATTLNPGQPASANYNAATGVLELGIPKGLPGDAAIATPTSLGGVMPQTGDEDGLELGTDGKLRVRKASASQRGSVLASVTAAANSVPMADSSGVLNATWLKVAMEAIAAKDNPVATLIPSFATIMPGYLLCNGAEVSRTTYKSLFDIIGTRFGEGDGSTTFNLPDFRGKTLWGADSNLMSVIAAGLPNFPGTFWAYVVGWSNASGTGPFYGAGAASTPGTRGGEGGNACVWGFDPSRVSSVYGNSNTVQPPAIAANIFIKY